MEEADKETKSATTRIMLREQHCAGRQQSQGARHHGQLVEQSRCGWRTNGGAPMIEKEEAAESQERQLSIRKPWLVREGVVGRSGLHAPHVDGGEEGESGGGGGGGGGRAESGQSRRRRHRAILAAVSRGHG